MDTVDKAEGEGGAGVTPPRGAGMEMRLDDFDVQERENIRLGTFKVDSGWVGSAGEDFLKKVGNTTRVRVA